MNEISSRAYAKIILHAAKYVTLPVAGILIGSDSTITDAIPIAHSLLLPTPMTQAALEQITIHLKTVGSKIIGLYFANECANDRIHPFIELLGTKIVNEYSAEAVILKVLFFNS